MFNRNGNNFNGSFNGHLNGNGYHGSLNGNGYHGNDHHDVLGDLAEQEAAAQNKRLEPPNPAEFLKWVTQTLREHREKYAKLAAAHKKLVKESETATVGLDRLRGIITFKDSFPLEALQDMHRSLDRTNMGIGYTLQKCKKVLDETTTNYQLIGETLKSPLADRHKKIGVRKELGLRLRDIDGDYTRCFQAVAKQKKQMRQLSEGIQKLLNKASISLPPKIRENINREDRVAKLALNYKNYLTKKDGKEEVTTVNIPKGKKSEYKKDSDRYFPNPDSKFGDTEITEETEIISKEDGIDPKYAAAALAAGATLGVILLWSK